MISQKKKSSPPPKKDISIWQGVNRSGRSLTFETNVANLKWRLSSRACVHACVRARDACARAERERERETPHKKSQKLGREGDYKHVLRK